MEAVSLFLILVGAGIIGVVLLLRLGLRHGNPGNKTISAQNANDVRDDEPVIDPLFAIEVRQTDVSDDALAKLGKVMVKERGNNVSASLSASQSANLNEATQTPAQKTVDKRRPPRIAEDPNHVVVLNLMAREHQTFSGSAVRYALETLGFEYGDWQIFHYYAQDDGEAPPLFSLANMVKPGNFELERMDVINTAGLSLFMVPAGVESDIAAFDTMIRIAGQLAEALDGEVRDARRSVLTRQAIGHIREQLNEWRCKARIAQH